MQIVFGGAFNGKRQYVKEMLSDKKPVWHEGELPESGSQLTVVAGLEHWIQEQLEKQIDEETIHQSVENAVQLQKNQELILILTDINRGIVPIDPIERRLRDVTGRIYQTLFKEAEQITRIWYGIPQSIKGADTHENLYKNR